MADKTLLNNKEYHIGEDGLPCLIHYTPKSGGSHFSVAMVADLFLRGSKILFLTAYPMAKDNFMQQIKGEESKTSYITDVSQISTDTQAIILESGNEGLYLEAVKKLNDLSERVVLIKNIEVFSDAVFDHCLKLQKVILSGNIDTCSAKKQISSISYKSKVLFNKAEADLKVELPSLKKYQGYLWATGKEGLVQVRMED